MIKFNELKITPDGLNLIIDAEVKSESYYSNIYIDSIKIDTQDTYTEGGPSSQTETIYQSQDNEKSVKLNINSVAIMTPLKENIIFVYVIAKVDGTISEDIPCGKDNITTIGVALDLYSIYRSTLGYTKELANTCAVSRNFINYILQYKAFDVFIKTGHYTEAIKLWNKFFKGIKYIATNNCGCYG